MSWSAAETLARRLNCCEREKCVWKWRGVVVLAAVVALGLPAKTKAARQATVKNDVVYVYAKMNTTSYVVTILRRGERVMVNRIRKTAGARWCSISELSQMTRLGYVRCKELERWEAFSPRKREKPTSEPTAKTRDSVDKSSKRYTLLVASLVDKQNAFSVKRRLEDLGYTPVIHMSSAPITRHRVYGGDFGSREEAETTARRLNVDGYASKLVETEGRQYRLEVGWYFSLKEARDLANTLKKRNYNPTIVSKTTPTPVHQVRVGKYTDREEALKAVRSLEKEGLVPRVVTDSL
jgi:cell division septation protein DedD